jgi:hypothetical protein
MASPFRHFRKHQKTFFAVASVLAIGLFVFSRGSGGGPSNGTQRPTAPVASWNGGSLNEGQLGMLVQQRLITNDFLRKLFVQGGGQSIYDFPPNLPFVLLRSDDIHQVQIEVINTEVFASLAEKAGMSVSDDVINHYMEELGGGRLDSDDIVRLLAATGDGHVGTSEAIVFGTLRKLLLEHFYRNSYRDAASTLLPTQRWEDWRRINERISLEVAVLPTDDFLGEVKPPTDAELQQLYAEFKEYDPGLYDQIGGRELPTPNPGFAAPRRVTVQYLKGSLAERTEKLLGAVTEEEIVDYYERNKRTEFLKTSLDETDDFDNEGSADAAGGDDAGDAAAEGAGADGSTSEGAATDGETPAADAGPSGAAGEATDASPPTADGPAPAAESGAAEPAASEATPETGGATPESNAPSEGEAGAADQSSIARERSPFRLAALQAAAEPSAQAAAEDEAAADAAEGAASPAQVDAAPAGETASEAAAPVGETASDAPAPATGGAASTATEPPVEYEPLDAVRDEIRKTLAGEKAVDELKRQFNEARGKLQTEYNLYGRKVAINREAKKAPPAPPEKLKDLKWLADEFGVEFATTDPLTARELRETPVGAAVDEQSGRVNATQAAFQFLQLYEPFLGKDLDGDWYLVTKVADEPRKFPPFNEVRDQVVAAWKRSQAAKLAEQKGKELAKQAEAAAEPFDEFFKNAGYKVVPQTAMFSWRNYALAPGYGYPAMLSEVPELENIDPEFMQAAFSLKDSEIAVRPNHDHSATYVFRLHSRQYPPEELRRMFLREIGSWPGNSEINQENFATNSQAIDQSLATNVAGFEYDEEWLKRFRERATGQE